MLTLQSKDFCRCDLGKNGVTYAKCCLPYHSGKKIPETAVDLMRSRYCAFVLGDLDYIQSTWHPETCPKDILTAHADDPVVDWIDLEVCSFGSQEPDPDRMAYVEFIATFEIKGETEHKSKHKSKLKSKSENRMHELSQFVREFRNGFLRWYYVNGEFKNDSH